MNEMASSSPPVCAVQIDQVTKIYRMGEETVEALKGVSLDIEPGEYVSIMGPSGSGKSTLFNMIGGLDLPTRGKVFIEGVDIASLDSFALASLRCRKIGYIFQTFNLIPMMTALENCMLPLIFSGLGVDEARDRAAGLLDRVGLGGRMRHKPLELSGGQQQRVACARALANQPSIVLADEPTGNLDFKSGKELIELLRGLNEEHGVTIISATHDLKMLDVSGRVVWIRDGQIDKIESRSGLAIAFGSLEGEES